MKELDQEVIAENPPTDRVCSDKAVCITTTPLSPTNVKSQHYQLAEQQRELEVKKANLEQRQPFTVQRIYNELQEARKEITDLRKLIMDLAKGYGLPK